MSSHVGDGKGVLLAALLSTSAPGEAQNVHGRRVVELARARYHAGAHALAWSGRDAKGQRVPPGVYTCRLEAAGARAQVRLVVVP